MKYLITTWDDQQGVYIPWNIPFADSMDVVRKQLPFIFADFLNEVLGDYTSLANPEEYAAYVSTFYDSHVRVFQEVDPTNGESSKLDTDMKDVWEAIVG